MCQGHSFDWGRSAAACRPTGRSEATIERLQRARSELALILRHRAPADLPPGFSSVADALPEPSRSLVMIYSQVYDESAMSDLRQMLEETPRTDADEEFEKLPPDADQATRRRRTDRSMSTPTTNRCGAPCTFVASN